MDAPKDPSKHFDKDDYYAHPEHYYPVFHKNSSICHGHRYDPLTNTYHEDMNGEGVIFLAVDILPTEVAKEFWVAWILKR